jgi:hypothetical protein
MVGDMTRLDMKEDVMNRLGTTLVALGLCVAAAACQSPQQKIAGKEDMMTAAGFKFVPANTPARQQAFKQLPAHRFSRQIRDGRVFYVYPDPTVCVCLYVGDQNAYALYRKNMFDKQLADEQQMTAQEMEMNSWDWGPWGGYPMGWYY